MAADECAGGQDDTGDLIMGCSGVSYFDRQHRDSAVCTCQAAPHRAHPQQEPIIMRLSSCSCFSCGRLASAWAQNEPVDFRFSPHATSQRSASPMNWLKTVVTRTTDFATISAGAMLCPHRSNGPAGQGACHAYRPSPPRSKVPLFAPLLRDRHREVRSFFRSSRQEGIPEAARNPPPGAAPGLEWELSVGHDRKRPVDPAFRNAHGA